MQTLFCHPETPAVSSFSVEAEIARVEEGMFVIHYSVDGATTDLAIPEPVQYSTRRDGLWQTTCFEAFASAGHGEDYLEFNFAPSTEWAAYSFGGYRDGGKDLPLPSPHFDVGRSTDRLEVTVAVDTTGLEEFLPSIRTWKFNLTAVIEEKDGTKSYWALAHPDGPPDFHNRDCFIAHLPPVEAP